MPISYMYRILRADQLKQHKRRSDRTDDSLNTKGPTLGTFCSYKGIEYLLEIANQKGQEIDINTLWIDNKGRPYHVLTLALREKRWAIVIKYLLELRADVNIPCGLFYLPRTRRAQPGSVVDVALHPKQMPVLATPLHEAIRARAPANLELIISKQPEVTDPALCLYLVYRCTPKGSFTSPESKVVDNLQKFLRKRYHEFNYETIARWDTLNTVIATGDDEMIERLLHESNSYHLIDSGVVVESLVTAVKSKQVKTFRWHLSASFPGFDPGPRKAVIIQLLRMLERDPSADDLFCTYTGHRCKGMAAHRPLMIYELWEQVLSCGIQPSAEFYQKMITPIFWSATWGDGPESDRSAGLLRRVVQFITGRDFTLEEAVQEASKHAQTQLLDALCQPFRDHKECFDRAVDAAIKYKWDMNQIKDIGGGLTILHYAVAISPKAAKKLSIEEIGLLRPMLIKRRTKLLLLAARYGYPDFLKTVIKGQDQKFVNSEGSLEDFPLLNSADIPKLIKGKTTALHIAACCGHEEIVNILLASGADVNMRVVQQYKIKKSELRTTKGKERATEGDSIYIEYTNTALTIAAAQGRLGVVESLLQKEPDAWRIAEMIAREKFKRNPEKETHHREIARKIGEFGLTKSAA
ncbi:hypothetical protein ABW21_db0203527 [Orbilia brochopaga]|nr:hypothetical protein ABW21_db0203527 [Drechslerella brochopaga]